MYELIVENQKGKQLELTHNKNYAISKITGLTPAKAAINTATMGNFDGERFSSSRVGMRNIVITIYPQLEIETARIALYEYFRPKQWCRLFFTNKTRKVYIDGYVETFDGDLFELGQKFQISILCPMPYFSLASELYTGYSRTKALFEFPFAISSAGIPFSEVNDSRAVTIDNGGDVEIGLIIELIANGGDVSSPIIYNADTRERFSLENITIIDGDIITIDTRQGEKKITRTRNGITTNIIGELVNNVNWFQIGMGENTFTFSCDDGEEWLEIDFSISEKFQGV